MSDENEDFKSTQETEESSPQKYVLQVIKDEYFQLYNSKEEEFITLRALKDFEVLDKGVDPWDLASSLESDGFAEILPQTDVMDGIDYAWED
jgi:hypothetical protein